MTDPQRRRPRSGQAALVLSFGITALIGIAGCSTVAPTTAPRPTPTLVASVEPSPDGSTAPSQQPPVGQTDTDWGRIWDMVPAGFPIYPGATPAEEAASGPVSATFALDGANPKVVATWMQNELERAGHTTESLNGPFEDGSYVLDSIGAADCRIQIAVAPLGTLTTVTVRYAAACPGP